MLRKLIVFCILHILNGEDTSTQAPGITNDRASALSTIKRVGESPTAKQCLTGYMTDVQDWVDANGNLNANLDLRLVADISKNKEPVSTLNEMLSFYGKTTTEEIKYLSMSRCNLKWVPTVFKSKDYMGRALYSTVEYITLYGNEFMTFSTAGVGFNENMNASNSLQFPDVAIRWPGPTVWATGLSEVTFQRLRQLDLRKCHIQHLTDNLFSNMPKLEALYLGENQIAFISSKAFRNLKSLVHLDISRNFDGTDDKGIVFEDSNIFSDMKNLQSLDLSMTLMPQRGVIFLKNLTKLRRLSICYTGLVQLPDGIFKDSPIRHLDVSGNIGIFSTAKCLTGLSNTLQILYAKEIGLKNLDTFYNFTKLEILDIEGNEVNTVARYTAKSLQNLLILNLNNNRLTTWFENIFSYMTHLTYLSIRNNNVNMISTYMINDLQNISYLGLSGNFFVCNCQTREFFEIAYRNENKTRPNLMTSKEKVNKKFSFNTALNDFNAIIESRNNLVRKCYDKLSCEIDEDIDADGKFLLVDYEENLYHCLQVEEGITVPFSEVRTCPQNKRETDYIEVIEDSKSKLLALISIPAVIFPVLIFCYVFRRNLKYFCITIRNSATLSMINSNDDGGKLYHYDVFVSYCNDDRNWMLDEMLPNVEKGCNISVCLHERDFQVGLSILENIVSCMDRSRSIMLVISKQFLMSQWCQFEMHLAQHRLLETRREDLILVLLEEIPRNLRPTTLHYLMLTKTYIVWPQKTKEQPAFWKRLSRSILARRQYSLDNISLA